MATGAIELQFPNGGIDRRYSYQKQPPYTTPDASNVMPFDVIQRRGRGGTRPGIEKSHSTQLGSASPVRMLDSIRTLTPYAQEFTDTFSGTALGLGWETPINYSGSPCGTPTISGGYWTDSSPAFPGVGAAIDDSVVRVDTTKPYSVSIVLGTVDVPISSYATIYFFVGMTDSLDPTVLQVIWGDWTLHRPIDGILRRYATLYNYLSSGLNLLYSNTSTVGIPNGCIVTFSVNPVSKTVSLMDTGSPPMLVQASYSAFSPPGDRIGMTTLVGSMAPIDTFRVSYTPLGGVLSNRLLALSGGSLYAASVSDGSDIFEAVSGCTINSATAIHSAQRLSNLYIADYGDVKVSASDGTTNSSPGTTLDSATVDALGQWNQLGFNTSDYVVVITSGSSGTIPGVYEIASIGTGNLTLTSSPGASKSGIVFTIERCPKVYNGVAGTVSKWLATNGGIMPVGYPILARFLDRMYFAGHRDRPHEWLASRTGDPLDWDYGASPGDPAKAIGGATSDAGDLGVPITALIPYGDDYLIFAGDTSLWKLVGDPQLGGRIFNVSYKVGCIAGKAWAYGPKGELWILARDGLYVMVPGGAPESVSRERMPAELINVDTDTIEPHLCYDPNYKQLRIWLTDKAGTAASEHWVYDYATGGFWPVAHNSSRDPFCSFSGLYGVNNEYDVLIGCRDGYVRRYRDACTDDDGTAIDSYVLYGPIQLGGPGADGIVSELIASAAKNSGMVAWRLYTGTTPEDAYSKYLSGAYAACGRWNAGDNYVVHPRCRGGAAYLKLESVSGSQWSMESITATIQPCGRLRLR